MIKRVDTDSMPDDNEHIPEENVPGVNYYLPDGTRKSPPPIFPFFPPDCLALWLLLGQW